VEGEAVVISWRAREWCRFTARCWCQPEYHPLTREWPEPVRGRASVRSRTRPCELRKDSVLSLATGDGRRDGGKRVAKNEQVVFGRRDEVVIDVAVRGWLGGASRIEHGCLDKTFSATSLSMLETFGPREDVLRYIHHRETRQNDTIM